MMRTRGPADDAYELIDAAMPQGSGYAVMLSAYFDESERTTGVFSVAGIAFRRADARRCQREWAKLFQKYGGCHMTDLANRQGRFKGIPLNESRRLIERAIEIINQNAVYCVAVSCDLAEIEPLLPKHINGFEGAYPVCCHLAKMMMGDLVAKSGTAERIAYFFESGHKHQGAVNRFVLEAGQVPQLADRYRHHSHVFADKEFVTQLQAADVLAWEWSKYLDETVMHRKRPMRLSLAALLIGSRNGPRGFDRSRTAVTHTTGEPLKRFAQGVHRIFIEDANQGVSDSPVQSS